MKLNYNERFPWKGTAEPRKAAIDSFSALGVLLGPNTRGESEYVVY